MCILAEVDQTTTEKLNTLAFFRFNNQAGIQYILDNTELAECQVLIDNIDSLQGLDTNYNSL